MVAFIVATVLTFAMTAGIIVYANIRPADQPTTWGEAMVGSAYVFMLLMLVFGMWPDQFIDWVDAEGWDTEKLFVGPGGIIEAQAQGGWFPFTITYQAVRDVIWADGVLDENEEKLVWRLAATLGMPFDEVRGVLLVPPTGDASA